MNVQSRTDTIYRVIITTDCPLTFLSQCAAARRPLCFPDVDRKDEGEDRRGGDDHHGTDCKMRIEAGALSHFGLCPVAAPNIGIHTEGRWQPRGLNLLISALCHDHGYSLSLFVEGAMI